MRESITLNGTRSSGIVILNDTCIRRDVIRTRRFRLDINAAIFGRCRRVYERYGLIGTAAQLPEAAQTTYTVVLQADTDLEDKTVYRGCRLHLRDAVDINSDRNMPSSFLIRFEKSTDSPGSSR